MIVSASYVAPADALVLPFGPRFDDIFAAGQAVSYENVTSCESASVDREFQRV